MKNKDLLIKVYNIGLLNLSKFFPFIRNFVIYQPKWIEIALTSRCCLRCIMCNYWKFSGDNELSFNEIQNLLFEAKNLGVDVCHLYGGEPFMRKEIFEIIDYANNLDMKVDITSNGYLISEKIARDLTKVKMHSVNISIDGLEKTHDTIRNVPGSFKRTMDAVNFLTKYKVKTTVAVLVTSINMNDIIPLIDTLQSLKVPVALQLLDYTPFYFRNENIENNLWVSRDKQTELNNLMRQLIAIKRRSPRLILNSVSALHYIGLYFRDPKMEKVPCYLVYLGRIWVSSQGDVHICQSLPAIGNIRKDSLHDIIINRNYIKKLNDCFLKKCPGCSCGFSVNATADLFWIKNKFRPLGIKQ